ncbi:MAG: hypothetical protein AAFT19_10315 [Pseudomonadota bacterium]
MLILVDNAEGAFTSMTFTIGLLAFGQLEEGDSVQLLDRDGRALARGAILSRTTGMSGDIAAISVGAVLSEATAEAIASIRPMVA